jgi:hypothetical protein
MSEPRPLHRLFGLSWIDFFQGTDVSVEPEMDLSLKQQFIDVVIIRRGNAPIPRTLPDGFENLAPHNLVTFKSHQEALDGWALCELVGHYVNYRKQSSPSMQKLLPEDDYRLFAVCVRFPENLAKQLPLTPVRPGVYDVRLVTRPARVVVVSQLPQEEQNAMLLLFSAREDLLRYGREHFRPHSTETSSLLLQLLRKYGEDPNMSDKLKEFVRETVDELLKSLPAEERLKGMPAEERLKGMSADEIARALPRETLEAALRQLKANGSSGKEE